MVNAIAARGTKWAKRVGRHFERCVTQRWRGSAMILTYHRVAELFRDPQLMAVAPARFAEHLEVIRRYWHPMDLRALTSAIALMQVPHRAICITLMTDIVTTSLTQSRF